MSNPFTKGWELAGVSFRVLRADTELLVFPVLSFVCAVLGVSAVMVPAGAWWLEGATGRTETNQAAFTAIGFVVLFVIAFVETFFEAALTGAAMMRLRGGDPTVMTGLRIASSRLGAILRFALLAATVGLVLRALQRRDGKQSFLSGLLGAAWAVATYLVVPVLVMEPMGAFAAVKRSAELLKKMWGDQVSGRLTMGALSFVGMVLVFALCAPFVYLGGTRDLPELIWGSVAGFVLGILVVRGLTSALNGIFAAAVYLHVTGETLAESEALSALKETLAQAPAPA